jgi:hypothetical protein
MNIVQDRRVVECSASRPGAAGHWRRATDLYQRRSEPHPIFTLIVTVSNSPATGYAPSRRAIQISSPPSWTTGHRSNEP